MTEPHVMRIHLRLYDNRPDDVLIMDWLDSLPSSATGKKVVKQAIVSLLANALRGGYEPPAKKSRKRARTRERVTTDAPSPGPISVLPVKAKVANKTPPPAVELPDFPNIDDIRF